MSIVCHSIKKGLNDRKSLAQLEEKQNQTSLLHSSRKNDTVSKEDISEGQMGDKKYKVKR